MKNFNIYAVSLLLAIAFMFAYMPVKAQNLKGNRIVKTETRNVSGFSGIKVSGGFTVEISQSSTESVRLEADENLLSSIKTEVRNGVLHIYSNKGFSSTKALKAHIRIKELKLIDISGGVKVSGNGTFKTDIMELDLSGGSKVSLNLNANQVKGDLSGASKVVLKGKADKLSLEMSGASSVNASELVAKHVNVGASGASNAKVFANSTLQVDASGASSVSYKGNPNVTSDVSAAAKVSRL